MARKIGKKSSSSIASIMPPLSLHPPDLSRLRPSSDRSRLDNSGTAAGSAILIPAADVEDLYENPPDRHGCFAGLLFRVLSEPQLSPRGGGPGLPEFRFTQTRAIQLATKSRFSHMGIILRQG